MILKNLSIKNLSYYSIPFWDAFFLDIPHKVNQGHPQNAPHHKALKIFLKLND